MPVPCRPLIALSLTESDEGLLQYSAWLARLLAWSDVHFAHVPLLAVKHYGSRMTLPEAMLNHRFWERPVPKSN